LYTVRDRDVLFLLSIAKGYKPIVSQRTDVNSFSGKLFKITIYPCRKYLIPNNGEGGGPTGMLTCKSGASSFVPGRL
jgi:hypothetical protein